ncbi:MAG: chalcone synthase [Pirellulaceae bacterium]|nr:MAG: chalcone synthase [Pirellulaceae bacterium]
MGLVIRAIGTATPQHWVAQPEAAQFAMALCCNTDNHKAALPVLYRHSGVHRRYSVLLATSSNGSRATQSFYLPPSEESRFGPSTEERMRRYQVDAPPLAVAAARAALGGSGIPASQITHLVTVSCTGFHSPGWDITLMGELPLPNHVSRTHIGFMGCHGALNALRVARAFVESDPEARVLLCAVELCSLHHQYGWDPQQIVANALFADGAACLIGTAEPDDGPETRRYACHSTGPFWILRDQASTLIPGSLSMMSWTIGDHGFRMSLSPQLPDLLRWQLGPCLDHWLERQRMVRTDIRSWAIHPGGPRILKAVAEALGLDDGQLASSREVLAEFGNMSSASILFVLRRLQEVRAPLPCVALAFGPGITVEAALFDAGSK